MTECNAERVTATIAAALRAANITQRTAAHDLGVSPMYLHRRLSGRVRMSLEDTLALTSYLRLDLNELMTAASAGAVPIPALAATTPGARTTAGGLV